MRPEAGGVEEGVGLVDAAAGREGGQIGGGPTVPGGPGLLDEFVDAEGAEPISLGRLGDDGQTLAWNRCRSRTTWPAARRTPGPAGAGGW